MMLIRALIFSLLGLSVLGDLALAGIYQYADDPGSIPENQRKRVKVVEDDRHGRLRPPETRTDDPAQTALLQNGSTTLQRTEVYSEPALQPVQPAPSHEQLVTINTDTVHNVSAENNFVIGLLQSMLNEKFKNVKDPSQLPALNADTSIDCTKYKKTLDEDFTKMDALMKNVNKRKARGDSEVLIKLQAIWGLRYLVDMIYDIAFTPKHCQDEYDTETKGKWTNIGSETAGGER